MKKILIALMLSAGLHAGGDLPEVEYVYADDPQTSPFYIGAGLASDYERNSYDYYDVDTGYTNVSVLAGAAVAREGSLGLAIEGRVSWSLDEYGVDAASIYLKPEIEVGKGFTTFAVIGYQNITTYEYSYDALGLGIGGAYLFTDYVGVQVDYIYSYIAEDEFGITPEYANLTASLIYKF